MAQYQSGLLKEPCISRRSAEELHAFTCKVLLDTGDQVNVSLPLNNNERGKDKPVSEQMKSKGMTNRQWFGAQLKKLLAPGVPFKARSFDNLRVQVMFDDKDEPMGLYPDVEQLEGDEEIDI